MFRFEVHPVESLSKQLQEEWSAFVDDRTIYQTLVWAEYMAKVLPKDSMRLYLMREHGKIIIGGLGYTYPLKGKYYWLYFSRGPIFSSTGVKKHHLQEFFSNIKKEMSADCVWVRFDPLLEETPALEDEFSHFKLAHASFHPKKNLVVDLSMSEEEILAQMTQKGRYNVRLAEKKGVEVYGFASENGELIQLCGPSLDTIGDIVGAYVQLTRETTARDGFSGHEEQRYRDLLSILGKEHSFLLMAKYEGSWIAGGIFSHLGNTCTYYYGASSDEHRNVMAPYLVQWEAMKYAKNALGCEVYDFLGISDETKDDRLRGVRQFKKRFGGREVTYVGTFEIVINKLMYFLVTSIKKLRKLRK